MRHRLPRLLLPLSLLPLLAPTVRAQVVLGAGDDGLQVVPPRGALGSALDFSLFPIPQGFLFPGSDPFQERVALRGVPLVADPPGAAGEANAIVRRTADSAPIPVGGQALVPVELVALRLRSCEHLVVTSNGGQSPEDWTVELTISPSFPRPVGSLTVRRQHADGGNFDATLALVPALRFRRVSDGLEVTLDGGFSIFLDVRDAPWTSSGGPGGFDPGAFGVEPIPPGVQLDGDGDGVLELTTLGASSFQPAFGRSACGFSAAFIEGHAALVDLRLSAPGDLDGDGWPDALDGCPLTFDPLQADGDGDGAGDGCDAVGGGLRLNELYVSHDGDDDQEFIELLGTPGLPLDGVVLLAVEGDAGSVQGTLSMAFDLSGSSVPADGYLVVGDAAVANVDVVVGMQDAFPDGSETFYLGLTSDPAALLALVGSDLDPERDGVTEIACLVDEVLEVVALFDGDDEDRLYDGAHVNVLGPASGGAPAGVYRGLDFPAPWCGAFLDPDAASNPQPLRTPGATNWGCFTPYPECDCEGLLPAPGEALCFGDGAGTACPCGNAGQPGHGCANGDGPGSTLIGSGSASLALDQLSLHAGGAIPGQPGLFFQGDNAINGGAGTVFGDGLRCAGMNVVRLGVVLPDAGGFAELLGGIAATAQPSPGETKVYQYWYRDPQGSPCGAGFNLSNAYRLTWGP